MKSYKTQLITCILFILLHSACTAKHKPGIQKQTNYSSSSTLTNKIIAQDFLFQVNLIRNQARNCGDKYFSAAPPLKFDNKLDSVARLHSIDMSKHNSLSHTSSNGDNLVKRLYKADYVWRAIAENIAHNQRSVTEVLADWLSSTGHCSNLMSPDYQYMGFAQENWYWTQVFATPK